MPARYQVVLFAAMLGLAAWALVRRRSSGPRPMETEARPLLRGVLEEWRERSYDELAARVGESSTTRIEGPRGLTYQVEVQVFWDDHPGGVLRVRGAIDDGGLRAFMPFCEDFLMRADGALV